MGGSGVTDEPKEQLTCSQLFHKVFPEYLAMGMTYEQFWEQDCSLVIAYRKAYKLRQEEKNREAWLHGLYILKALQSGAITVNGFAPKGYSPEPYPNQPIDFTPVKPKTEQEKLDEEVKARSERIKLGMMNFIHARQAKRQEEELRALMEDSREGVTKDGGRNGAGVASKL